MSRRSIHLLAIVFAGVSLIQAIEVAGGEAQRQRPGQEQRALGNRESVGDRMTVEMQIGTEREVRPLQVQQWSQMLKRLNVATLSIRASGSREELDVTEERTPGGRHLVIRGHIDSRGRLVVPGYEFSLGDSSRMAAWLRELKRYGPAGSPEGKPLWGLSEPEFRRLFASLSAATGRSFTATPLAEVLVHIRVRSGVPIEFDTWAPRGEEASGAASRPNRRATDSVSRSGRVDFAHGSLSLGTALAFVLHDQGLAFRVAVTRDRDVRLVVLPSAKCVDPWPIGWPRRADQSLQELAPKLMAFTPVKLVNAPLVRVLDALQRDSEIPFLLDGPAFASRKIDLSELRVDYEKPRAYRKQILDRAAFSARLEAELRTDEAGAPLIWISPMRSAGRSLERSRPAVRRLRRDAEARRRLFDVQQDDRPRPD